MTIQTLRLNRVMRLPKLAFGQKNPSSSATLLTGSALLLVSTTIVNFGNYLFNLLLGRWLGPAAFADLSLIVTLMLMVTLVTATLQTVVAKVGAGFATRQDAYMLAGLGRWARGWAWLIGSASGGMMALAAPWLQGFFHTQSAWPFVLLGVGIPVYFAQGVDRGLLQGKMAFGRLAASYQAEMWVRLLVGIGLVLAGFQVNGAVAALTLSFVGAWLVARSGRHRQNDSALFPSGERREALLFAGPVGAALIGQILINNSDVLIVKHFFSGEDAGLYAALALIGRIVFFATWSVVTVLLPVVAQRHKTGQPHRNLLWAALGAVLAVSVGVTAVCAWMPDRIIGLLFGPEYLAVAPLLWLYATATSLYALANVIITYRLSTGSVFSPVLAVLAGLAQIMLLWMLHNSLQQVVLLQIGLMGLFLLILLGQEAVQTATGQRRGSKR